MELALLRRSTKPPELNKNVNILFATLAQEVQELKKV
jgi:hypothetical protein